MILILIFNIFIIFIKNNINILYFKFAKMICKNIFSTWKIILRKYSKDIFFHIYENYIYYCIMYCIVILIYKIWFYNYIISFFFYQDIYFVQLKISKNIENHKIRLYYLVSYIFHELLKYLILEIMVRK